MSDQVVEMMGGLPRNDQERAAKWESFMRVTAERAQVLGNAGMVEEARCYHNSIEGGNCPRCGAFWDEVLVDNRFVLGVRYRPTCACLEAWSEMEEKFADGSKRFRTRGPRSYGYLTVCDKCGTHVKLNHRRRRLDSRDDLHPRYERVLCAKCRRRGNGADQETESQEE